MKNIFVSAGLVLALIGVNQIWAQEQADEVAKETTASIEQSVAEEDDSGNSFKLDIGFTDDEQTDQESIDQVAKILRKVAGDDVADEVLVELEGLSAEEKKELANAFKDGVKFNSNEVPGWVGIVAILGVILIFGFPILVLIAVFVYLARKRRQKMDVIQVYLDAGKDVPAELLRTFDSNGSSFKSGVMLVGTGLGVVAAFNALNEPSVGALGLIPLFVGIAKLVYWFFEERKYSKV